MCKKKDRTDLIIKVLKETPAVICGGVKFWRKRRSVVVFNSHGDDFLATGLFKALGAFKTKLTASKKGKVYLKIK